MWSLRALEGPGHSAQERDLFPFCDPDEAGRVEVCLCAWYRFQRNGIARSETVDLKDRSDMGGTHNDQ